MSFVLIRVCYSRKSRDPERRAQRLLETLRGGVPDIDPEWLQRASFVEPPEVGILIRFPEQGGEQMLDRVREILDRRHVRYEEQRLVAEEMISPILGNDDGQQPVVLGPGSELAGEKLLESGKAFSHMGMLEDAADQLLQAVDLDPGCFEAYHYLVAIFRQLDRLSEAEALVLKGLRLHGSSSSFRYLAATVLAERGRHQDAVLQIKQAIRLDPEAGILYSSLGEMLEEQGELDAARLAYEEALARDPVLPEAAAGLGSLLQREGRVSEALDWLAKAVSSRPSFAEGRLKLGWCYLQAGQTELAELEFLQVANGPDSDYHLSARFCLGRLYLAQGHLDLAQEVLCEVCDLQPDLGEAHRLLAETCAARGHHEQALVHWHEALRLVPEMSELIRPHLALCLSRAGRLDEAERTVREVMQSCGETAELLEVLASIDMAREEWERADNALARAQTLDPESAMVAFQRGWVAENSDELQQAMAHYKRAIRLDPGLYEAYAGLGWLYYGQGRYDVARVLFEKALELEPDSCDFMDNLGWVHLLMEQHDQALELFEQALECEPESSFFRSHRGAALYHLGRIEEARLDVTRVIEDEPEPIVEAFARFLLGLILQSEGRSEQAAAEFARSRRSESLPPEFVALTSGGPLSTTGFNLWKGRRSGKRKDSGRREDFSSVVGE